MIFMELKMLPTVAWVQVNPGQVSHQMELLELMKRESGLLKGIGRIYNE